MINALELALVMTKPPSEVWPEMEEHVAFEVLWNEVNLQADSARRNLNQNNYEAKLIYGGLVMGWTLHKYVTQRKRKGSEHDTQ